jgi:hypothetical protein
VRFAPLPRKLIRDATIRNIKSGQTPFLLHRAEGIRGPEW